MADKKVFVYGTLKSGGRVRGLQQFDGAIGVGEATTSDALYSLFDLGAFPCVTLDGNQKIKGEVWSVDTETFKMLDAIEGYPDFYSRKEINTTEGKVWMYYIPDVAGYTRKPVHGNIAEWHSENSVSRG